MWHIIHKAFFGCIINVSTASYPYRYHPIQMWMNEKWLVILAHVQLFHKKETIITSVKLPDFVINCYLFILNDTIDRDDEMMWIILHKFYYCWDFCLKIDLSSGKSVFHQLTEDYNLVLIFLLSKKSCIHPYWFMISKTYYPFFPSATIFICICRKE